MSTTHATSAPARSERSVPVLGWVLGGLATCAVLVAGPPRTQPSTGALREERAGAEVA